MICTDVTTQELLGTYVVCASSLNVRFMHFVVLGSSFFTRSLSKVLGALQQLSTSFTNTLLADACLRVALGRSAL